MIRVPDKEHEQRARKRHYATHHTPHTTIAPQSIQANNPYPIPEYEGTDYAPRAHKQKTAVESRRRLEIPWAPWARASKGILPPKVYRLPSLYQGHCRIHNTMVTGYAPWDNHWYLEHHHILHDAG